MLSLHVFVIGFFIFQLTDCITEDIFLNSYESCGNVMFEVSQKKDYMIYPDITADTKTSSFRDCEVIFHSHREFGHICLLQTGNVGMISDPNAQLEARDGYGTDEDPVIEILKPYPSTWTVREYCSKSPYISLYLKEIRKQIGADINKVNIQFRVVDIESKERVLYLDGNYCNKEYQLLDSMVTLRSRPQFPGMAVSTLTSECGIRFNRIGGHRNTSICIAYVPSVNVDCNSQWRFAVSMEDFSLEEKYIKYSLKCNDSRTNKIHVWCAEPTVSFVTVIYWRADNILSNYSIEPSEMFRYIVKDHKGSEDSFLQEVKEMFATSSGSLASQWMIYTGVAVAFVLVVVVVAICCQRRMRYKPVKSEETSRAV